MIDIIPETARARNHKSMSGPKAPATLSVPFRWKTNNKIAITLAMRIRGVCFVPSRPGIRRMPSTALRMLIAGVMTPSPTRRDMPIKVSMLINTAPLPFLRSLVSTPHNTIVPPSPFSLRLMASHAYSTVTRMMSVHIMRERTPMTLSVVGLRKRKITVRV